MSGTKRLQGRGLSPREHLCLRYIAQGLPDIEISKAMNLAPDTIRHYVARVLSKLGARNRAHSVALGYQRGLLQLTDGDTAVSA